MAAGRANGGQRLQSMISTFPVAPSNPKGCQRPGRYSQLPTSQAAFLRSRSPAAFSAAAHSAVLSASPSALVGARPRPIHGLQSNQALNAED